MKLSVSPRVFYRVPQFAVDAPLLEVWTQLKESIRIASPDFYGTISGVDAEGVELLPAAVRHTIWKYFNRSRLRATPFGSFAGFGMAELDGSSNSAGLVIDSCQRFTELVDWSHAEEMKLDFGELLASDLWLFANSSWYEMAGEVRYITRSEKLFQLSDVELDGFCMDVLRACRVPVRFAALVEQLGISEERYGVVEEMIAHQLLLTSNDANIIGEDYFSRIGSGYSSDKPLYLLCERPGLSRKLDGDMFSALPDLVVALQKLVQVKRNDNLDDFIRRFSARFEGDEVPLLLALDPELGIGYGEMEVAGDGSELVGKFAGRTGPGSDNALEENKKAVLNAMLSETVNNNNNNNNNTIALEGLVKQLPASTAQLPNTFSALCTVSDGMVCLEMVTGSTASSLLGRFSVASAEVAAHCRSLGAIEAAANPEVLFFDIAYTAEGHVDNVNRRGRIYDHQLSILDYDTSEGPLSMNDLFLAVRGGELILFSRRLKKRLVPRLASAYNYLRSDLSVFRLLCDMQSQGLQTDFSPSLEALVPGLERYPRLQFRNFVVSPARWLVEHQKLRDCLLADGSVLLSARYYLMKMGLPRLVSNKTGDMTLCFDLEVDEDVEALLVILKKQDKLYLQEAFVPKEGIVRDVDGGIYRPQVIVALHHSRQVYSGYAVRDGAASDLGVQRVFPPGQKWLYFELYCHVYRSDSLLMELKVFLQEHEPYIAHWFFIRYNEHGDHLRLRIRMKDDGDAQLLINGLSDALASHLGDGTVSDIQLKSYKRELQRYGAANIERVEEHFGVDSGYVMAVLEDGLSAMDRYALCIGAAIGVRESGVIGLDVFDALVDRISGSFASEHRLETADYKLLNGEYKAFRGHVPDGLSEDVLLFRDAFVSSLVSVLEHAEGHRRGQLLGDLLHMHVNRLFASSQRTHEMVVYYLLGKELLGRRARAKAGALMMVGG